jgi:hypothetical protein
LSARKQNGGGSSTPPPGTGGDSNGGQNPSKRGGSSLQQSDDSDGEKQSGRLGSGAAVVCSSLALKEGFYRLGRGRELGFPEVAGAGKFSGCGGSVDDVRLRGRVVGDAAPPLACWHRSLTSVMARRRACWSGDREAVEELFLYPPAGVRASPTGAQQRRGRGRHRVR